MQVRNPLVLLTARGGTNLCCFWFLSVFVFTGAQPLARTHFAHWMKGQRSGSGSTLKAAFHVSKRGALIGGQTPGLLGLPYSLRRVRGESFGEQQYPQVTLTRWPRMLFCWVWLLTPQRSSGTLSIQTKVLSNIDPRFCAHTLEFCFFFVCWKMVMNSPTFAKPAEKLIPKKFSYSLVVVSDSYEKELMETHWMNKLRRSDVQLMR